MIGRDTSRRVRFLAWLGHLATRALCRWHGHVPPDEQFRFGRMWTCRCCGELVEDVKR